MEQAPHQQDVGSNEEHTAQKPQLLSHGTEDEIGVLFRDELQFCEVAVEQARAEELAGANADLALNEVIANPEGVLGGIEKHHQPIALVLL